MSGRDPLAEAVRALKPAPPAERLDLKTIISYARDEFEPSEREVIAEHLADSPEDAEMMLAWSEFGEEVPTKLTPVEEDAAWQRFEDRLAAESRELQAPSLVPIPTSPPPLPTALPWMPAAVAASLVVAVLSVTWALWEHGRNAKDLGVHGNPAIVGLSPDSTGPRDRSSGPEALRLSQGQTEAILVLTPTGDLDTASRFEGKLLPPSGAELWRETLIPTEGGTLTVRLEPPRLARGRYTIAVEERRGSTVLSVARFSFEIVARDPDGGSSRYR